MPERLLAPLWPRIGLPRLEAPPPRVAPLPAAPPAPPDADDARLPENTTPTAPDDGATRVTLAAYGPGVVKGPTSRVLVARSSPYADVDADVDCGAWNAVHVDVLVTGANPTALLQLLAAGDAGAVPAAPLQDPRACQTITASTSFDLPFGGRWLRLQLSSVAGVEPRFTVVVTPWLGAALPAAPVGLTPAVANLELTLADTEYSLALPANCRRVEWQCRAACDVRFAWEAGKVAGPVAPYATLKAGRTFDSGPIAGGGSPATLYVACSTAGQALELWTWT